MLILQLILHQAVNLARSDLPLTEDVLVNGVLAKVKYCHACVLYTFTVHQGVLIAQPGTIVLNVLIITALAREKLPLLSYVCIQRLCYVFAFCWVSIRKIMDTHECNFGRAVLNSTISAILMLYTFAAVWFVGGLTSFHL